MKAKNKRAIQIENKRRHRENQRISRRKAPALQREAPGMMERPTILIVCEGKNTEPSYFRQFKLSSATVKAIGEGYNTLSLVERARELAERKSYDQIWCVFDADPKRNNAQQGQSFNEAIRRGEQLNFGIAYSHQAFEYWLILHFDDHQGGPFHRKDYAKKLNQLLKPYGVSFDGKRSKIITEGIFELLEGRDEKTGELRIDLAIRRAVRNYDRFDHQNPANEESSTTVFRLIEELRKHV